MVHLIFTHPYVICPHFFTTPKSTPKKEKVPLKLKHCLIISKYFGALIFRSRFGQKLTKFDLVLAKIDQIWIQNLSTPYENFGVLWTRNIF